MDNKSDVSIDMLRQRAKGIGDADFRVASGTIYFGPYKTCVGVACKDGVIAVRNTNDSDRTTVLFSQKEWDVFVAGVKNGEFDV